MKTKFNLVPGFALGALLLLTVMAAGCASSGGKPTVRVTEEKKYILLNHVQDTSQPLDLKKGDAVAMACSKCKTIWYDSVDRSTTRFYYPFGPSPSRSSFDYSARPFPTWERRHYCPGCKSTITTTGSWKDRKAEIKHTCTSCGDESVFCCATRKDTAATEGMEKK